MSLYSEYIREREGKQTVENDKGFATYSFNSQGCYIEDIYVTKQHRGKGAASDLANEVAAIAKEQGCSKLYGSVVPSANGSTDSLKVLMAYGFRLDSCTNNFILLVKEL